jgi:hypothetical protein
VRRSLELLNAQVDTKQLGAVGADTGDMREMAVKLLAKNAVTLATVKPEDVEGLSALTKVLLASEENEIRLRRVKLDERYFDFEANTRCAEDLKKVRAYLVALRDNEYLSEEDGERLTHQLLFGKEKVSVQEAEEARSEESDEAADNGNDPLASEQSEASNGDSMEKGDAPTGAAGVQ